MPANINITFSMGALPEGFRGTPQEFADLLAERLQAVTSSDSITLNGQIGGSKPTRNLGMFFDTAEKKTYFWNEALSGYYPTVSDVPIGTMLLWPSANAPSDLNYVVCSGQLLTKTLFPSLYAVIGDLYKLESDGSNYPLYFRLPKPQGRTPMGAGQGLFTDNLGNPRQDKTKNIMLGKYDGFDFLHFINVSETADFIYNERSQVMPTYTSSGYRHEATPPCFGVNFIIKAK